MIMTNEISPSRGDLNRQPAAHPRCPFHDSTKPEIAFMKRLCMQKESRGAWIAISAVVLCAVGLACLVLPPSRGRPQPLRDDRGRVIPGSLSEKTFVHVNGTDLGMWIRAKDAGKPVLLLLGGGPGIPEYFLEQQYPTGLDEEFVVAYLEYRGTSLSYRPGTPAETMSTEQYISDVVAVTNHLRERFGQDRLYLMAHCFGTSIGVQAVARHPELYHAYIAMSQIVDQVESERTAYTYMLEQYRAAGNTRMVRRFERTPILTSDDAFRRYFTSSLRDTAMHDLGVGTTRQMRSVISGIFFTSLRTTVYTPRERVNIWRGKALAQRAGVTADAMQFNALQQVPSLDVPVYFLAGAHDYTCDYTLQKRYFELVRAPAKAFYTFADSAHSPLFAEPERALAILAKDVLTAGHSLSDAG